MTDKLRKYVLPNIPYVFIGWVVAARARWQTARVPCQI